MNGFPIALMLSGLVFLSACTEPDPVTYPISGEPCAEDDPVKDIEPLDCVPVGTS